MFSFSGCYIYQVSEDSSKIRRSPDKPLPDNTKERKDDIIARSVYVVSIGELRFDEFCVLTNVSYTYCLMELGFFRRRKNVDSFVMSQLTSMWPAIYHYMARI